MQRYNVLCRPGFGALGVYPSSSEGHNSIAHQLCDSLEIKVISTSGMCVVTMRAYVQVLCCVLSYFLAHSVCESLVEESRTWDSLSIVHHRHEHGPAPWAAIIPKISLWGYVGICVYEGMYCLLAIQVWHERRSMRWSRAKCARAGR